MLEPEGPASSEEALPITAMSSCFLAMAAATWGRAKSGATAPAAIMHSSASLAYAPPPIRAQISATANGLMPLLPRGLCCLVVQGAIRDFVLLPSYTTRSSQLSQ